MRLIDADELKKRATKLMFRDAPGCGEFDAVAVDDIDCMPTIDPESLRPTAEWEMSDWAELKDGEFIHYPDMAIRCSNCLYNFKESELECRSYCPNCGARMVNAND